MSAADISSNPGELAALPANALAIDYDNPLHQKWSATSRRLILPADSESRGTRILGWTVALLVASLYLFMLLCYWAPAHPGVDQNGYFVGGRQFAETLSTGITIKSPFEFIGRMWIRAESGENFPKYPLGLPILFALCIWLQPIWNLVGRDGHDVAHLISPISAALAILGIFAFVRRLSGSFAGLLAMLILGMSQVMLTLAINPNSHALGTCLTVWGFFLMIRWLETGTLWRGMLCAFLLGYAFLVRYTEGLQALPLGVAMLFAAVWWRPGLVRSISTIGGAILFVILAYIAAKAFGGGIASGNSWLKPLTANGGMPYKVVVGAIVFAGVVSLFINTRSLWRLLLVGFAWLVPVLYQTIFNMVEMRSFTSYAGTNESTGFDMDYFQANWEKMIRVLNDQGLFFIAPIGFIGLLVMFRKLPLVATILTLWFVPSVLLYTAYYWAPDQWGVAYSRFILTELPAMVIPAAWLMGMLISTTTVDSSSHPHRPISRFVTNSIPRIAIGAAAFVACGIATYRCVNGTEWGQRINARANIEAQSFENKNLAMLGQTARKLIPAEAIVFADGDRLHHLQWLSTWDMFPADGFNPESVRKFLWRTNADEAEPDPIDPGRMKFLREVYASKDQNVLVAEQNKVMADALKGGRRVFAVLNQPTSDAFIRKFVTPSAKRKPQKAAAEKGTTEKGATETGAGETVPADTKSIPLATSDVVFEAKVLETIYETAMPRTPFDFLEASERPKMPIGRGGRLAPPAALTKQSPTVWKIVEIIAKKVEPTTKPATVADGN